MQNRHSEAACLGSWGGEARQVLRFSHSSSALWPCPAQGPALGASQPRGGEPGPPWAPSDRGRPVGHL